MAHWWRLSAAGSLLLALPLGAQTAPNLLPELKTVAVSGSARYSQAVLDQATGLQLGQPLALADLHQAMQRLRATGLFTDVTFHYNYNAAGTDVQFQLADVQPLIPVAFDNFVWMPQDALIAALEARVPLFDGQLPESGGVNDAVTAAIQAILQQHGVSGSSVVGMPFQAQVGMQGYTNYKFFVHGVAIPMTHITVTGASPAMQAMVDKDAAGQLDKDYSGADFAGFINGTLLPEYQNHGYLAVRFGAPNVQLTDPATNGVSIGLDVTEGPQFHWGAIACQGNAAMATAQLDGLIKSRPGAVADRSALEQDAAAIQSQYQRNGFMEADASAHYDLSQPPAARATIAIREGPQYTMGALSFSGVADNTAASLAKLWTLAPGQPFRATAVLQFMAAAYRQLGARAVKLSTTTTSNAQTHTVDVRITVAPAGGG